MKDETQKAVSILKEGSYTCVLCKESEMYTSEQRGVRPLLDWLNDGIPKDGFCAADKVIGKASAFIYVLLGVSEVWGGVVSEGAISVLEKYSIGCTFEKKVPSIRNRSDTGMCPMEESVLGIDEPEAALKAVERKLDELSKRSGGKETK